MRKTKTNLLSIIYQYNSLLIVGEFKFTEIIEKYLNLIAIGGIIVVFSTYLEKLHEVAE